MIGFDPDALVFTGLWMGVVLAAGLIVYPFEKKSPGGNRGLKK